MMAVSISLNKEIEISSLQFIFCFYWVLKCPNAITILPKTLTPGLLKETRNTRIDEYIKLKHIYLHQINASITNISFVPDFIRFWRLPTTDRQTDTDKIPKIIFLLFVRISCTVIQ